MRQVCQVRKVLQPSSKVFNVRYKVAVAVMNGYKKVKHRLQEDKKIVFASLQLIVHFKEDAALLSRCRDRFN